MESTTSAGATPFTRNAVLAERIRAHRQALNMSQEELAERCLVSRPTISNWEHAKTEPSACDLALLAAAFDINADDLLVGVAPARRRTSAPRQELKALFFTWYASLFVSFCAVEAWSATGYGIATWQFVTALAALGLTIGLMIRARSIARKHRLRTVHELVAYAQGELRPDDLSGRPGWVRALKRHDLAICAVCGVLDYLLVDAYFKGLIPLAVFAPLLLALLGLLVVLTLALDRL